MAFCPGRKAVNFLCLAFLFLLGFTGASPQAQAQISSEYYYRLSTQWQGDGKVLSIELNANGTKTPQLSAQTADTNQLWKLTPLANGFYRLTTKGQGDDISLDIYNDGKNNNRPTLGRTGNASGQMWKLTRVGNYYRLTTSWRGDGNSLDVINDGKNNQLILNPTGSYTGQMWKLTKTDVQTSLLGAGNFAAGKTVNMLFINDGTKTVGIYRSTPTGLGEKITDIRNQSQVKIPVKIGDQFEVMIGDRTDIHPKVYISDLNTTGIIIHGNQPYSELKATGITYDLPDYQPNLTGVDLTTLNPRDLVSTINKGKIFEALDPVNGVDYHHDGNKLIKYGFTYAGTNLHTGSKDVSMAYGYSAFSKDWSVNVGAKGSTPKGIDGSLDVNYSSFENEERSQENVYAYTREQSSVFSVAVDPIKARLDSGFKLDVLAVKNANDAKNLVRKYGTHFPTVVYYGGDRSVYVVMNKDEYSKAKGYGIDVKAEVSKSKDAITSQSATSSPSGPTSATSNYGSKEVASGKLGISYKENEELKEVFEQTSSKYRMIGGSGGFESWEVNEGNAAPISVELENIYELIDPRVFKDGTSATDLARKKSLIKTAVLEHLRNMPKLTGTLPAPRVYSVTLNLLKVTEEVDDANKNTKGNVTAVAYYDKDGGPKFSPPGFNGALWSVGTYSTQLYYQKGKTYAPNTKATIVQPSLPSGKFRPLYLAVGADIYEKDDCCGDERHRGSTKIQLDTLKVNETKKLKFNAKAFTSFAEKGTIEVTVTVRREPSEFDF